MNEATDAASGSCGNEAASQTPASPAIPAAGAGIAAVQHELLGAQAREAGLFVEDRGIADQIVPALDGMGIHLDHTRVRRHLNDIETIIVWRRIPFHKHGETEILGGVFN